MKKGGKENMAMGGVPMVAPAEVMPARKRMAMKPRPMMSPMQERAAMMTRKKGGEIESPKMHKSEMKQMGKIEKELKSHEGKPASKAHKGLKSGGSSDVAKYKDGGHVAMTCKSEGGYTQMKKMSKC